MQPRGQVRRGRILLRDRMLRHGQARKHRGFLSRRPVRVRRRGRDRVLGLDRLRVLERDRRQVRERGRAQRLRDGPVPGSLMNFLILEGLAEREGRIRYRLRGRGTWVRLREVP